MAVFAHVLLGYPEGSSAASVGRLFHAGESTLGRIPDHLALQFWDPKHVVAAAVARTFGSEPNIAETATGGIRQACQELLPGLSANLYRLKYRHLFLRTSTKPDS
jgi:hypothetical protein